MKKLIYVFILLFPLLAQAQLKINEIMSNNISAVLDDTNNYSMWVELYNAGTTSENQGFYYFTDNLLQPKKWRPLSKAIPPGGFNVLWFEREERGNHAKFKLNPEGGTLYLLNTSSEIVDSVAYPRQYRNISYGRITDGADGWVHFIGHSSGASNNNNEWAYYRCSEPEFELTGGFYPSAKDLTFKTPANGDTIYYTINGAEPTRRSMRYTPGRPIKLSRTMCIRAITLSSGKLPSDIISHTYFINERDFNLPVFSIITESKNLYNNTIGIYIEGTNGITGNCSEKPVNWNQGWDRPANFELFDVNKKNCLNQELDIAISGGCTRMQPQKSLKISPRKKFGENQLRYDIFAATKPNMKYKDILVRNSGNDFWHSMMRDGFMQSLIINRLDIDYQAYQPAVCFLNGSYYGIQNIRERTSKDYLYSNYGLDEEDIYLFDHTQIYSPPFSLLTTLLRNNDITQDDVLAQAEDMMDIDNYIDYMQAEIYYDNTDWPYNNLKVWKKKQGGKWRWILYDTDFGFDLYNVSSYNNNTLQHALNQNVATSEIFNRLLLNEKFKNKFIDRYCIQLSSTFEENRVNHIMDSLSSKIRTEITYHNNKWWGEDFDSELNRMKTFSRLRPEKMLGFISSQFLNSAPIHTIDISSNIQEATFSFNGEKIIDNRILLKSYKNRDITIKPAVVFGYDFKHWEYKKIAEIDTVFPMGSTWKYWDKKDIPATNWFNIEFDDSNWESGEAQLGYGDKGETTMISYGNDPNNKYPTAYFRKNFEIEEPEEKDDFSLAIFVDDGAAIYVNGTEIGRYNLPDGELSFNTYANVYNNGDLVNFNIPKEILNNGANTIAVEIHQANASSSDLIFDSAMYYKEAAEDDVSIIENPTYTTTLTEDISLKAIYEANGEIPEPEEKIKVFINEIVANNSRFSDESGEKDDYIELYNDETYDIDIAGWFITDTPVNPTLSEIPAGQPEITTIPAKGRIIIWADKQLTQGPLHVGFTLSKESETIVLSRRNEKRKLILVDSITYPELEKNMSYSRNPDGSDNWVIQAPTFNIPNDEIMPDNIRDNILESVIIYPTMVQDYFIIENGSLGQIINIIDLTGNIVLKKICTSVHEVIQINQLKQGLYIVQLDNKAFKIVKM